jgi:nitrite reductase/ring-hydroxylating ferredoxin subunit
MKVMSDTSAPKPASLQWPDLPGAPAVGTPVGELLSFVDGQATMVSVPAATPGAPEFKLLVLRQGDQVHAFANRCAHFGVPLAAKVEQLISTPLKSLTCNVHYARYAWATGACEAGECDGEALIAVPLDQDNGLLRIGAPDHQTTRTS